jgi:hypothetical protein
LAEYGSIEAEIRKKYPEGGPLVELAARIARDFDNDAGSAAMARELRETLKELGVRRLGSGRVLS